MWFVAWLGKYRLISLEYSKLQQPHSGLRLIGGAAMQNAGAGAVVSSDVPDLRYVSFTDIAKMDPMTLKKALGPAAPSLPILPESRFSSSI